MSASTYRAFVVGAGLLSLLSGAQAQSACGLQGYLSCTDERSGQTTGYGCCPVGFECYATECSYTGTPTSSAPVPEKTECPGVPAHHLCPEASGGGCCYNAYGCDSENASQCTLTRTERVFDQVVTTTTVVDGKTETITTTKIMYPWPTVEPRVTPSGGPSQTGSASDTTDAPVTKSYVTTITNSDAPETTPAPNASETDGGEEPSSSDSSTSSAISTAAAGNVQAQIGAIVGGLVAGMMVQN
ncbi:hypothetical protein QBC37DRAFT_138531 [Rhypophila decipiens]|uniref:Uncharacterized protein n=1 Tax=Rhypophila decipiens TaxID=261697 RepID=A0AAN6XTG4_9PEZI|nr:hypothetical protein QBC37DRAFT_138531 [Rhypophila decipiens]